MQKMMRLQEQEEEHVMLFRHDDAWGPLTDWWPLPSRPSHLKLENFKSATDGQDGRQSCFYHSVKSVWFHVVIIDVWISLCPENVLHRETHTHGPVFLCSSTHFSYQCSDSLQLFNENMNWKRITDTFLLFCIWTRRDNQWQTENIQGWFVVIIF